MTKKIDKHKSCYKTLYIFHNNAIKDWNNLPSNIKEIKSENSFKEKVKKHLIEVANREERVIS